MLFFWLLSGLLGLIPIIHAIHMDEEENWGWKDLNPKHLTVLQILIYLGASIIATALGFATLLIGLGLLVLSFFHTTAGKKILDYKPFGENK